KLDHELGELKQNPGNAYAAINAARDAYHLREWICHDRLLPDPALQRKITGKNASESNWNQWINKSLNDFKLIRELCNGSKHFTLKKSGDIKKTLQGGWDTQAWDELSWDAEGFYIECGNGRTVSVCHLLTEARDFWRQLFKKHPGLR
ncbi:MAG: hypothetical protein ACREQV_11320, partial [Candidatus Binatia bacterium]